MSRAKITEGNLYVRAFPWLKEQIERVRPADEDQGAFLRRVLCDALDGMEAGTWAPPTPPGDAERIAKAKAHFDAAREPDLRTKAERAKRGRV